MTNLTRSLESATRKQIDLMLINLGWHTDETSPECNVFTERAKTVEQDAKFDGNDPDYVLYRSESDEPIGIIEAKRKGQDIDAAIQDAKTKYADPLGVKIIFAYDGAFFKSWHTEAKKELGVDGLAVTQLISEKKLLRFLGEGPEISEVTPTIKHSRSELISIFKWANDLLRKEGLREGIERFTEFANLLFLRLISEMEREREKEGEPRILDEQYCWEAFCNLDQITMMNYINDTVLPHLVSQYNHSGDVFENRLRIKNPKTLAMIVHRLSSLNLLDTESDVKGDAFEYFLKDSITVGNDLGEYFTPRHLVYLMIELVEPKFGEKCYDPTCGTAGFLIAAFNYIKRRCAKTKDNNRKLREETVYGSELTNTAKIAKMNMILAGDGHTNIAQLDSLANPIDGQYQVVLANPPYGQLTDYGDYYPVPSGNGDAVFVQHIYRSLANLGRAAVVVPEGLLFKGGDMLEVRKFLLKNCKIHGIISLPQGVFRPYANNKTNIVVFEKNKEGTKNVWFYNLEADGFDLSSDLRRPVDENDIPDLLSKWTEKGESSKSWRAEIRTIEENAYDLLARTYQPIEAHGKRNYVSLEKLLTASNHRITVKNDALYKQITVKLHGNGAVLRREVKGSKIKTKKQFVARAGEVVVSKIDARQGALAIVPKELDGAIVTADFPLFEVDENKISLDYLKYFLQLGDYAALLAPFAKGTSNRRRVRVTDILRLSLHLPEKHEQELISERIRKQLEIAKHAESTIDAIKEGIVDASDFQGDWKLEGLETVCLEISTGGTPSRTNLAYFRGGIPWIKISDMPDLDYVHHTEEKITQAGLDSCNAKMLPKGTVLIALYGASIGKVSILGIQACTNQAIAALQVDTSRILSEYLMYYLHTQKPYYLQKGRGVAQKNINTDIMKSIKIPVPPLQNQRELVARMSDRKAVVDQLEQTKLRALQVLDGIVNKTYGIVMEASVQHSS